MAKQKRSTVIWIIILAFCFLLLIIFSIVINLTQGDNNQPTPIESPPQTTETESQATDTQNVSEDIDSDTPEERYKELTDQDKNCFFAALKAKDEARFNDCQQEFDLLQYEQCFADAWLKSEDLQGYENMFSACLEKLEADPDFWLQLQPVIKSYASCYYEAFMSAENFKELETACGSL